MGNQGLLGPSCLLQVEFLKGFSYLPAWALWKCLCWLLLWSLSFSTQKCPIRLLSPPSPLRSPCHMPAVT